MKLLTDKERALFQGDLLDAIETLEGLPEGDRTPATYGVALKMVQDAEFIIGVIVQSVTEKELSSEQSGPETGDTIPSNEGTPVPAPSPDPETNDVNTWSTSGRRWIK